MDVELKIAASLTIIAIAIASYEDRERIKSAWRNTVGAWFARRRTVTGFFTNGGPRLRIDAAPSEHCQRHINTGSWT